MTDTKTHSAAAPPVAAKASTRWTVLFVLFLVRIAMGFQFQAIASVSRPLQDLFGFSHATIGTLVGMYLLPGVALAIPGGWLGGRIGDRKSILLGLGLMTVGGLLGSIADSAPVVMAGRALSGVGVVMLFLMIPKTVAEWFTGRQMFLAMAIYLNGWPVGIGIALIVQPLMASGWGWGWEAVFLSTAIMAAAAFLVSVVFLAPPPSAALKGTANAVVSVGLFRLSWREVILIVLAGLLWTSANSAHTIVLAFGPGFVETFGHTASAAGALVSINLWVGIISVPMGGWLASRFGRPSLFMALSALVGGGAVIMIFLNPTNFIFWFIVMGAFFFLAAGVTVSLPIEVLKPEHRAAGLGIFYTIWYAGMAGLPPLGGWTRDFSGEAGAPILFAGILGVSGILALIAFRLVQRRGATG